MTDPKTRVIEGLRRAARTLRGEAGQLHPGDARKEELLAEAIEMDQLALKLNTMTPPHVRELFA